MSFLQKAWWIVLYTVVGFGLCLVFGAAFAFNDPLTTFFTGIFTLVFIWLWSMIGVEIYRECTGANDVEEKSFSA